MIPENTGKGSRIFFLPRAWESVLHFTGGKLGPRKGKGVGPELSFPINPFLFLPDHVTRLT